MMHMQSKKKELELNIVNCPNKTLKNRFRTELLCVVLCELSAKIIFVQGELLYFSCYL
jgi:hypothetical protein